eukprot:TRINITY_DN6401_c0_g1_i1.p1 TRINITY_DN6401_c0_g1~~TRINITY_DN6401_c0_g1_i1.p1  ORF type:complete len:287 (-),score=34.50 TRINITY_DN6401_c0_g1_i1:195-1055(-)
MDNKHTLVLTIAGAVGGIAECIVVQPFDFIKTRFQLNPHPNPTVYKAFIKIMEEGGFSRFYRGVFPELAGMIPKSSVMYMAYEKVRRFYSRKYGMSTSVAFVAGTISGLVEAATVTPFQVVKVRLQSKEYLGRYHNSMDCTLKILREEGIRRFGRGLGPTMWRNGVWSSIYFSTMFKLKSWMPKSKTSLGDLMGTLFTGFAGGLAGTIFNAPFDMVKSRFQEELLVNGKTPRHRWTLTSLRRVFREEGLSACYKGFAPKSIRMGLGGGVCMAFYEATCYALPDKLF